MIICYLQFAICCRISFSISLIEDPPPPFLKKNHCHLCMYYDALIVKEGWKVMAIFRPSLEEELSIKISKN